jgi:ADP-ribose pyrophosphatase YjhB (NUDIX family)
MTSQQSQLWPWPRAAVSTVVFRGDTVLLVERGKSPARGLWSLPGGHIEPGEPRVAAARREVVEETGVTAEIMGLVDLVDVIAHDGEGCLSAHYVIAAHYGRWLSGEPAGASDSRDARFVPLAEVASYRLTEGTARVIGSARCLFDAQVSLSAT